jgi:cell division protein FtsQ
MAGLAVTVWWVANSSVFDLRNLTLSGNHRLTTAQVMRVAGLDESTNLVRLSTGLVERRLEASPWILRASVSRSLPSSVTIRISERTPVAVAAEMLVAADGTILGSAPAGSTLPHLVGGPAVAGPALPATLMPELAVAGAIPAGQAGRVASISVDRHATITATMRDGVRVVFGDQSEPAAKWQAVGGVLVWSNRSHVVAASIDVRVPSFPALRPEGGASGAAAQGSSLR